MIMMMMVSLNTRIFFFFWDIIINIFHRRISKRFLHTGWCLDFFFFFLASIFFTKSSVTVLKSFMKLERAGTSIRTVMFPRTLEYSSNRSNNTVSILIKILCRKWWLLLAPKKKERRGRKEGWKKKNGKTVTVAV